jgi:hypothetical protein
MNDSNGHFHFLFLDEKEQKHLNTPQVYQTKQWRNSQESLLRNMNNLISYLNCK